MVEQRSLILIKPDGVERNLIGEIIGRFEQEGLKVTALEMMRASQELLNKHYPLDNREYVMSLGHRDISGMSEEELKVVYDKNYNIIKKLQEYMMKGPLVKMILEGPENTVELVRKIVGKTDPAASPEGSIRGDLGMDSFAKADEEGRSVRNVVHASGTPEEAEQEIALWFGRGREN